MADVQTFRRAWGKFATGVAIVTTIESDGRVHGMTANGITSVSLEPLLILVCVAHDRNSHSLIKESGLFAINILSEAQQSLAGYFARPLEQRGEDANVPISLTKRGSAIVENCLAFMDCRVVQEYTAGDHAIFIAEVDEIRMNPGRPIIFFEGNYHRLGQKDSRN